MTATHDDSNNGRRPGKYPGVLESTDPEAFEEEFTLRMIVSAAGVPKVCALKRCRRGKRCFGPYVDGKPPCLKSHNDLVRQRFPSALKRLGWSCGD